MANAAHELGSMQLDLNTDRNKTELREAEEQSRSLLLADAMIFAKRHEKPKQEVAPPSQPVERWPMPHGLISQDLQLNLTREEKDRIGKKIWKNESGGTVDGLTAWNRGEEFPSLGIGHFIWMPKGVVTPFGDSFPEAMEFLRSHGKTPPAWIQPGTPAPWNSRDEFYKKFNSKQMVELRNFLADTVPEQTDFIIDRLEKALPKILAATPDNEKQKVQERFYRVLNSGPAGVFALADYVNFKGEGAADPVQYNNQGWGMRHVLQNMKDLDNPVKDFSVSAREMLERRVKNAPPERHEERWLKGWTRRVEDYVNDPPIRAKRKR
ncbi:MAG: hypothetical protein K2X77_07595 [Candidatus Obscuribacterales bacterium]|jgi:hypothetical protein|nr:hypothetical protein [Candidatus Obscuribacterales bacterium]